MRQRITKSSTLLVCLVISGIGLLGCPSQPTQPPTEPAQESAAPAAESAAPAEPPSKVAQVGPFEIQREDVLLLTREQEAVAKPISSASTVADVRRWIRRGTLDVMIERRLLLLGAIEHPEWVTDASAEAEVQRQLTSLGPQEVERRRNLAGLSKDEFDDQFRRFVREELMKAAIIRTEVDEKLVVTDEEIQAKFEQEKMERYRRPESWAVHHVDLYLPRSRAEEMPALRNKLESIRSEAAHAIESATDIKSKAEAFVPFVRKYSEAAEAQNGYAYIYDDPKVQFDPALKERVKLVTPGELSPVFDLAGDSERVGASFVLVFEHKPETIATLEQAERLVRTDLTNEKRERLVNGLLDRIRATYPVTIDEDALYYGVQE